MRLTIAQPHLAWIVGHREVNFRSAPLVWPLADVGTRTVTLSNDSIGDV